MKQRTLKGIKDGDKIKLTGSIRIQGDKGIYALMVNEYTIEILTVIDEYVFIVNGGKNQKIKIVNCIVEKIESEKFELGGLKVGDEVMVEGNLSIITADNTKEKRNILYQGLIVNIDYEKCIISIDDGDCIDINESKIDSYEILSRNNHLKPGDEIIVNGEVFEHRLHVLLLGLGLDNSLKKMVVKDKKLFVRIINDTNITATDRDRRINYIIKTNSDTDIKKIEKEQKDFIIGDLVYVSGYVWLYNKSNRYIRFKNEKCIITGINGDSVCLEKDRSEYKYMTNTKYTTIRKVNKTSVEFPMKGRPINIYSKQETKEKLNGNNKSIEKVGISLSQMLNIPLELIYNNPEKIILDQMILANKLRFKEDEKINEEKMDLTYDLLKARKDIKELMFKYEKGSLGYNTFNNIQEFIKRTINDIYKNNK